MNWLMISLIIMSVIFIILGLMLSGSGSSSGFTVNNGQDLELFKKTKDRGFIKLLQIICFVLFIVMFVLLVLSWYFKIGR